jgi:hypothetical protein
VLAGPWAGTAPLAVALPLVLLLWSVLWAGAFLAGMDCRRSTGWPVVGLLLVSATVTAAVAWDRLAQRWPQRSSGERVLAMVTVDSLPATQGGALGFEAEVQVVAPRSLQRGLRLQVTAGGWSYGSMRCRWSETPVVSMFPVLPCETTSMAVRRW